MDFGTFEGFWRRLAQTGLNAQGEAPIETILAHALRASRMCVVCKLLRERAFDVVSRWQYLLTEVPAWQAQFVEGQTWCNRHAWFFTDMASPRSLGRLHRGLHARLEARVGELLSREPAWSVGQNPARILRELIGERMCPQCDDEAAFLKVVLAELSRGLASGPLRLPFRQSFGCCLPHLAGLLQAVPDGDTVRFLLEATSDQLKGLAKELETYEVETESHRRQYGRPPMPPPGQCSTGWGWGNGPDTGRQRASVRVP
jgi:hypothetical protein